MLTAVDVPDKKMMDDFREYVAGYITKPFDPEELVDTVKGYFTNQT